MMEDIVWKMQQRSRTLQDYRKDIRGLWQDEAAKTLNRRYLDPHEDDDQKMIEFLQKQVQGLEKTNEELVKAKDYALEAERYSQQVEHYDRSIEYYGLTQAELPNIHRLIQQANRSCN
ncbi:MAG: hypothetical protein BEV12_01205 [Microcystis aeruginosa CACIAM 03]|nr:MAG: hypothetical protein BEV12_01205 [Microcystis aeruginosa CACIAM 03]